MSRAAAALLLGSAAVLGTALATEYKPERALRVESEIALSLQTTSRTVEVDGEERPSSSDSLPSSASSWTLAHVDRVVEADDGAPTKVRRKFEGAARESTASFGGEESTEEAKSPFEGVELELRAGTGEIEVEVVDGSAPDHEGALEGHRLTLALDALLPDGAVDAGATWELDSEAVRRALGFDQLAVLFPPEEREPGAEGGGQGGRGGRGRMGGRMGADLLARAEWKGKAELAELEEDVDGVKCARIALEIRAQGELPDSPMGAGRGGRALGLDSAGAHTDAEDQFYLYDATFYWAVTGKGPGLRGRAVRDRYVRLGEIYAAHRELVSSRAAAPRTASTYEIELEGSLLFERAANRPRALKLTGRVQTASDREMTRGEQTIRMRSAAEGELELSVRVADEPATGG